MKYFAIAAVLILLIVNFAVPPLALKYLNAGLKNYHPAIEGRAGGLSLRLWSMSARFTDLEAKYKDNHQPFFNLEWLEVNLAWRELLRLKLLADIEAEHGKLLLSKKLIAAAGQERKPRAGKTSQPGDEPVTSEQLPGELRIARVDVRDFDVHYGPWYVNNLDVTAANIVPRKNDPMTMVNANGAVLGTAPLAAALKVNRLAKPLNWEGDFSLKNFNLKAANPLLLDQVPMTFKQGHLDVFGEVKSAQGKIQGYVKPFLTDVKFVHSQGDFKSAKHWGIEVIAALGNAILKRGDTRTAATRIPFSGDFKEIKVDTGEAASKAVEHGFKKPIPRNIEGSVNLRQGGM